MIDIAEVSSILKDYTDRNNQTVYMTIYSDGSGSIFDEEDRHIAEFDDNEECEAALRRLSEAGSDGLEELILLQEELLQQLYRQRLGRRKPCKVKPTHGQTQASTSEEFPF